MRGKHKAKSRSINPDLKYNSVVVAKFINNIMTGGKKDIATKIVYKSLSNLESKTKKSALDSFEKALNNVKPLLEVKSKRIGGATYQVPVAVEPKRAQTLAMRWIIDASRRKKGKDICTKLSEELISKNIRCPVRIVSNGIPLKSPRLLSREDREKIRKKYRLKQNVMLFIGRVSVEKCIDVVMRASKRVFQKR